MNQLKIELPTELNLSTQQRDLCEQVTLFTGEPGQHRRVGVIYNFDDFKGLEEDQAEDVDEIALQTAERIVMTYNCHELLLRAVTAALPILKSHMGLTSNDSIADRLTHDLCEEAIALVNAKGVKPKAVDKRYQVIIRRSVEARPKNAKEGHVIFNAPDEMYGSGGNIWEDDSRGGAFYAAVDPRDAEAQRWIDYNIRMAGEVMEFVTAGEIKEWARREGSENGYSREDVDAETEDNLRTWFLNKRGRVKGEILHSAAMGWHVVTLDTLRDSLTEIINTIEEQCLPADALKQLNLVISAGIPERAAINVTKARREIEAEHAYTAGVHFLKEALQDIGDYKA